MTEPAPLRRCGHCAGLVPAQDRACPHCQKSIESYGALGALIGRLLPQQRPLVTLFAGACVALYALVGLLAGGMGILSPSVYTSIRFGALFGPYVAEGQWWRLVTPLFLHGDLLHLGFNLYALWLVGSLIENSFGKLRFLIIMTLTGLASTAGTLGWALVAPEIYAALPGLDPADAPSFMAPLVGISGSLTGLLGVGVSGGHKAGNPQGKQVRNVSARWMGFLLLFGLVVPNIGNTAHIAGFLVGLGLGWVLPFRDRASYAMGLVYAVLGALCAAVLAGGVLAQGLALPRQYPNDMEDYPTGVFGIELRENHLQDSKRLGGLQQACLGALTDLEEGAQGQERERALERARINCDEWVYMFPLHPAYFYASAMAHLEAGDRDFGCKRLRTAHLMFTQMPGSQKPADDLARELEQTGCQAP